MKQQGGAIANKTGKDLEKFVADILEKKDYKFVEKNKFESIKKENNQKIYTTQYKLCKGIYGGDIKIDFILHNPNGKKIETLVIECKWQSSKGSVDEKFPYLVENIKKQYPYTTLIILAGRGYKEGAENWLKSQIGGNLLDVFNMDEFQAWVYKGNID